MNSMLEIRPPHRSSQRFAKREQVRYHLSRCAHSPSEFGQDSPAMGMHVRYSQCIASLLCLVLAFASSNPPGVHAEEVEGIRDRVTTSPSGRFTVRKIYLEGDFFLCFAPHGLAGNSVSTEEEVPFCWNYRPFSTVWGKETDVLAVTRGVCIAEEAPALYRFSVDDDEVVHVDFRDIASFIFSDCNKRYPPKAPPEELHERRVSMAAKEFHSRDKKLVVSLESFSRPYPEDRWKYSVIFDLTMNQVDFLDGDYIDDSDSTRTVLSTSAFHGSMLGVNTTDNAGSSTRPFQITIDRRPGLPGSGVVFLRNMSEGRNGDYPGAVWQMPLMFLSDESPVSAWTPSNDFAVCAGTTAGNLQLVCGCAFLDEKNEMHVAAKYLSHQVRALVEDSFGNTAVQCKDCFFEKDGELLTIRCVSISAQRSQGFRLRYSMKSKKTTID